MSPEELEKYSYYLAAGASAAQAADMARGAITGKGQSWLPNKLASSAKGIPNASTASWWKSGKVPFGLKGTFMGAAPTAGATLGLMAGAGLTGFQVANSIMDSGWADNIGLGRNDFKDYGSSLFNLINPTADTDYGSTNSASSFDAGNINVEDYSVTQQRVQAERAAVAQSQAAAKQQQILADQTRMQQGQTSTPVLPAPVKQTVMNTPSNQTKFGANRSTAIKGGRGARGNYNKPAASSPAPVFKSYGPPNMQRFR
tara:strand:- start:28 stop:798 length:771 start_codon:yes stop_codon:yes gene_type:complete